MICTVDQYAPEVTGVPQMLAQDLGQSTMVGNLQSISHDVQLRLAVALAESGHDCLRPSFGPLLEQLRDGALPVGQVAAGLHVSAQAASRAALMLESFGYVTRAASAVDGRSRVLALTSRGDDLMSRASATFVECERAYEVVVGRTAIRRIRRDLNELRVGLELAPKPEPQSIRTTHSMGSVILIALCAERQVVASANRCGHRLVRKSHIEVLTTVSACDVRVTDIARERGVTRQAISATVQELEGLGYVERRPDSSDKRAVLIAPSIQGVVLLNHVADVAHEFEVRCQEVLGERRWVRFVRDLGELAGTVSMEAGTLRTPSRVRLTATHQTEDLVSLAEGLRSQLGNRGAARLGALLTTGDGRSSIRKSRHHEPVSTGTGANRRSARTPGPMDSRRNEP
jgi:DNA-binding MarR family transcriptional regulator